MATSFGAVAFHPVSSTTCYTPAAPTGAAALGCVVADGFVKFPLARARVGERVTFALPPGSEATLKVGKAAPFRASGRL